MRTSASGEGVSHVYGQSGQVGGKTGILRTSFMDDPLVRLKKGVPCRGARTHENTQVLRKAREQKGSRDRTRNCRTNRFRKLISNTERPIDIYIYTKRIYIYI